jgi:hypothetical protein
MLTVQVRACNHAFFLVLDTPRSGVSLVAVRAPPTASFEGTPRILHRDLKVLALLALFAPDLVFAV